MMVSIKTMHLLTHPRLVEDTVAYGIQGLATIAPAHVDAFLNSEEGASMYAIEPRSATLPHGTLFPPQSIVDGHSPL